MSVTTDLSQEKLMGWVKDGKKEHPAKRMCYGGVTAHAIVHLKTSEGEVITYPLHSK
jgi:hypothetical protein